MHNLSLQLLFHDYDLVSHTTYVLCVNFLHMVGRSVWSRFWTTEWNFIYSHCFCQKSAERMTPKKYFFHTLFSWRCLKWWLNRGLKSNKPTHYILHHGNFFGCIQLIMCLIGPIVLASAWPAEKEGLYFQIKKEIWGNSQ